MEKGQGAGKHCALVQRDWEPKLLWTPLVNRARGADRRQVAKGTTATTLVK